MKIRLNIDNYEDRLNVVNALANAGILVAIETGEDPYRIKTKYFVVFDYVAEDTKDEPSNNPFLLRIKDDIPGI